MAATFGYYAYVAGTPPSMLETERINVVKGFLLFFSFLGLCLVTRALLDARRLVQSLSETVTLSPERIATIERMAETGDDTAALTSKLTSENLTEVEIKSYAASWCKPEA